LWGAPLPTNQTGNAGDGSKEKSLRICELPHIEAAKNMQAPVGKLYAT